MRTLFTIFFSICIFSAKGQENINELQNFLQGLKSIDSVATINNVDFNSLDILMFHEEI